jgi:hypothetical protein
MHFLMALFGRGCSHRFSWPRVAADGRYYQICPNCGIAYEYDWAQMKRTERLLITPATQVHVDTAASLMMH